MFLWKEWKVCLPVRCGQSVFMDIMEAYVPLVVLEVFSNLWKFSGYINQQQQLVYPECKCFTGDLYLIPKMMM